LALHVADFGEKDFLYSKVRSNPRAQRLLEISVGLCAALKEGKLKTTIDTSANGTGGEGEIQVC
jgi:hypothetical protein